ncbi:hypothetical protein LB531_21290 [Mesorhizobium sp. CO1-1-2]|uniref:hypothetical protein n=1 Tax=Mesorhizobium sp. CO1-1-2 TaxID=2876635 RepID=UPI001CCFD992|nr:hypothetical protein [Mesorhizobium sp. CO1-1-2]MBZ9683195.1 hypothetical protein [Mesorhizobium sp. CO1-1-2]
MKISSIPSKFAVAWASSASPSYIRAIPLGSQIGITGGAASLTDGFPPLNFLPVGSGGIPPFGQDMNGILKQITQWSQWQNAGGLVTYDPSFSTAIGGYPFGALLAGTTAGVVWLSTVDDNTSDPDTGGANWKNIGAQASSIMVGVDAGSANVVTANVLPAPSAYADGQVFFIQKAAFDNNGPMTGNIESLGSHPVVNMDGTALAAKQWPASGTGILEFNNATTSFRLLNPAVTVAANAGLSATDHQVLSLNIPSLPAPTGALSLADSIALQVVSDGAAREVTLLQLAATLPNSLTNVRVFTLSATYTPTAGAKNMIVFATGGGGAGGNQVGGGASSGGTALYFGAVSSQVVTIGAGGIPNPSFGTNLVGGSGGTTSFGALAVATGGSGGSSAGGFSNGAGSQSVGIGTAGTLLIPGNGGSPGTDLDGGCGGASFWGGGGFGGANPVNTGSVAGGPGSLGGGGGGADGPGNAQGGAGGAGVVVIFEFL